MKRIILLVIIILSCKRSTAQTVNDTILKEYNDALFYLEGIYKPYSPARAFNMLIQLAKDGYPRAMNSVAVMYAEGIGTDKNYESAFSWFEKAASAGYYSAFYNLGLFWKYGYGISRNEAKELECYIEGAQHGDPDCKYAVGYMYFKGIACKQDYGKALEMFFEAADSGNTAASYMIGICYRNGYGITRDEAEARSWLEISASGGNYRASIELSSDEAENHFNYGTTESEIPYNNYIPVNYTGVVHDLNGTEIAGKYTGYLVTYDWSGKFVVGLNSLKLDIQINGNTITGFWTEADTNIAEINAAITDTGLIFNNVKFNRTDHYHGRAVQFDFKSADIQVTHGDSVTILTGNIQFFSEVTMEPEKPMYISLIRTDIIKEPDIPELSDKPLSDLIAFPNPFQDQVNISFNLKNESDVNASVFTSDGRIVYRADFGKLQSGINIQSLKLNVPHGIYLVRVTCGSASVRTIIVK